MQLSDDIIAIETFEQPPAVPKWWQTAPITRNPGTRAKRRWKRTRGGR